MTLMSPMLNGYSAGSIALDIDENLIYAPFLYDGYLVKYSILGGKWLEQRFGNERWTSDSFRLLDPKMPTSEYPERTRAIQSSGGPYVGIVFRQSLGLFVTSEGYIIHFIQVYDEYERTAPVPSLRVEVYSKTLELIADQQLTQFVSPNDQYRNSSTSPIRFSWMDKEDRLYVVNRMNAEVEVFQLKIQ